MANRSQFGAYLPPRASPFIHSELSSEARDDSVPRRCELVRGGGGGGDLIDRSTQRKVSGELHLIEPDPLLLENKLKICFSLQALTRAAQLKETIAVWY